MRRWCVPCCHDDHEGEEEEGGRREVLSAAMRIGLVNS